ncbi:MAG: biotin transporter BioY [Clostridiales bacterium]|nr:biotin transporter BioY [Clostridiales bacterium]
MNRIEGSARVRELTAGALCTAVTCLLAPVSIPIGPVELTMGVFGILLCGALLPPPAAVLAALSYLLIGFAGFPVFAGYAAGPGVLLGLTGGYLLAYPLMAGALSLVCRRTRSMAGQMAGVVLALGLCYLPGTVWFMAVSGMELLPSLSACVFPFVLPDLLKGACAVRLAELCRQRVPGLSGR